MGDLTKNFSRSEFKCKCGKCDCDDVNMKLVEGLQELRDLTGEPIIINSAVRCAAHNKAVGGVADSQHVKGTAADVRIAGMSPKKLAEYAEQIDVFKNGGIGIYSTFVHLDVRGRKARWKG